MKTKLIEITPGLTVKGANGQTNRLLGEKHRAKALANPRKRERQQFNDFCHEVLYPGLQAAKRSYWNGHISRDQLRQFIQEVVF